MNITDILQGLMIFPQFQISLLERKRKKSGVSYSQAFVDKIVHEMRETEITMHRAAAR